MGEFDLVINAKTAAKRQSFLAEFNRSAGLHGDSYDIYEEDGVFILKLKPNAPTVDGLGFPLVYMDICDWQTMYKEPST